MIQAFAVDDQAPVKEIWPNARNFNSIDHDRATKGIQNLFAIRVESSSLYPISGNRSAEHIGGLPVEMAYVFETGNGMVLKRLK